MFISNRRTWTSTLPAWCTEILSLAAQVKCFLCWLCLPVWSPLHKSRFSRLVLKNLVGHGLVGTRLITGFGEQPLQRLRNAEKVLMWFSWTCLPVSFVLQRGSSSPLPSEVAVGSELRLRGEVALAEGPQTRSP